MKRTGGNENRKLVCVLLGQYEYMHNGPVIIHTGFTSAKRHESSLESNSLKRKGRF